MIQTTSIKHHKRISLREPYRYVMNFEINDTLLIFLEEINDICIDSQYL